MNRLRRVGIQSGDAGGQVQEEDRPNGDMRSQDTLEPPTEIISPDYTEEAVAMQGSSVLTADSAAQTDLEMPVAEAIAGAEDAPAQEETAGTDDRTFEGEETVMENEPTMAAASTASLTADQASSNTSSEDIHTAPLPPGAEKEELTPLPANAVVAGKYVVQSQLHHGTDRNLYRVIARRQQKCTNCGRISSADMQACEYLWGRVARRATRRVLPDGRELCAPGADARPRFDGLFACITLTSFL